VDQRSIRRIRQRMLYPQQLRRAVDIHHEAAGSEEWYGY
jgi:hypothetical protein